MNNKKPFNAGLAYAEYKQRQIAYIVAAITAYLMSAYFVVGYFAGHLRIMEWDGSQWAQAIPSLGLVAVMTAYQFFLYSKGDTEGGKKATIIAVCVAVGFSLLSEIGQGMERDNIRMETKSQESPTYKAIVASLGAGAGASYNPYSTDLQTAEMKLAQCEARLAQGKEKHCQGSKARVDAVNKMIATADQSSQSKALALAGTAKTMERDENNYHPLVKFIREVFGAGGTVASFLLSLTLISFFEYAFHYLGGQFAEAREYLMAHGYDVTRKLRQPPRKHDGSVTTYSNGNTSGNATTNGNANETAPLSAFTNGANSARQTVGEYAQKLEAGLKASPEIIATEYARANYAHNQMMEDVKHAAGKVGDKLDELAGKPDKDVMNEMLRTIRTQVLNSELEPTVKALYPAIEKTLYDAGYETPKKTVRTLAENLLAHLHMKDNVLVKRGNEYQLSERYRSDAPALKEAHGFKQSPEQLANVERLYQEQMKEHERANLSPLSGGNTLKYLTPKLSVEETVKRIQADTKASGATSPAAIQAAVFDSFAALPNPAPLNDLILERIAGKLATATKGDDTATVLTTTPPLRETVSETVLDTVPARSETAADTVPARSQNACVETVQNGLTGEAKQAESDLYPAWISKVKAGEISPGARDCKRFISQATKSKDDKTGLTVQEMGRIWIVWQTRASQDNVLKPNPDYSNGKPKYVLA